MAYVSAGHHALHVDCVRLVWAWNCFEVSEAQHESSHKAIDRHACASALCQDAGKLYTRTISFIVRPAAARSRTNVSIANLYLIDKIEAAYDNVGQANS